MKAAEKLRKFRRECEREAGADAHDIEVPLAHVLIDICKVLRLPGRSRRQVVGRKAYRRLNHDRRWQAELKDPPRTDA